MDKIKKLFKTFYPTLIFILIFAFLLCPYCVNGSSMCPYLEHNDKVLIDKISINLNKIERYDIIVFKNNQDNLIKRVIGLPGETVQIIDSTIYINNKKIEDKYKNEDKYKALNAQNKITLKSNEYFVLGDNRNYSIDSRYDDVGIIKKERIIGKYLFKF